MAEAGGGVKRRCGSNDSSKRCYCLPQCSDILPGCSCVFSRSLAVSGFPSSRSWVFGGYLPLFLCFFFRFFLLSVSLFFSVLLPCFSFLFYIYRSEKVLGPSLVCLRSGFRSGWSATTRDSNAPLPCFRQGERPVGQWLWSVVPGVGLRVGEACGPRRERKCVFKRRRKKNQRKPFFFPPVLHVQGRKKEEQCRSKRHRSVFFFFLFFT